VVTKDNSFMKLLLIEDDRDTALTIKSELTTDFVIDIASSGEESEYQIQTAKYDIILLDLDLPDTNGYLLCKRFREEKVTTPIIILTGEDDIDRKVLLLNSGADDYVTKPFSIKELRARIRAVLRRQFSTSLTEVISVADLVLDLDKKSVTRADQVIPLRRKEFHLLEYLVKNAGKVITRDMILNHVWESNFDSLTNVVDVHIKYLRDRIDKPFARKLIKTVHGLGYKIDG
jgi:two-component system, OmpR family, copper resistance phosphate regulon response regulator CusR